MSDPISPTGSPGQVSQAATGTGVTPLRPAASEAAVAKTPSIAALEDAAKASTLELSPQAAAEQSLQPAKPMDVADAAKAFQEYLKNLPSDLQFQPDASSGIVVFKVINPITQKVIRQYPPEEMLEMARSLKQSLKQGKSGILLDHNL